MIHSGPPPGYRLFFKLLPHDRFGFEAYKSSVLVLTFVAYALYHASRKPPSIVKNTLCGNDDSPHPAYNNLTSATSTWPLSVIYVRRSPVLSLTGSQGDVGIAAVSLQQKGWVPFDGKLGPALLGEVDVAFLTTYAIGMFFAGHLGDRICLRSLLAVGMVGSGICVCLFGLAYWWNIHWLSYFLIVQMACGLFEATGWPSVVTIVGNWFGKSKRGLIMGVWNAHTSLGNICGTLVASTLLRYGWGWSFVVPGLAIVTGGIIMFLFLVVHPEIVGLSSPCEESDSSILPLQWANKEDSWILDEDGKEKPLLETGFMSTNEEESENGECTAVSFLEAWAIPRVSSFAFCLFFSKLVAYTFLYWLPFYIRHTEIQGEYLSDATAGNLSTIFDIGGTLGGILAGYLSDKLNARGIVAAAFIYLSLPLLLLYRLYGSEVLWLNMALLFFTGFFVNGPYALITTAVSADLGTHKSLKGNARAMATVTAIIDGTGSVGAALGPLLTGYLSKVGWNSVFTMLMLSATTAALLLTGIVVEEWKDYTSRLNHGKTRIRQIDLV